MSGESIHATCEHSTGISHHKGVHRRALIHIACLNARREPHTCCQRLERSHVRRLTDENGTLVASNLADIVSQTQTILTSHVQALVASTSVTLTLQPDNYQQANNYIDITCSSSSLQGMQQLTALLQVR